MADIFIGEEPGGEHFGEEQRADTGREIGADDLPESNMRQARHRGKYDRKVNVLSIAKGELSQPARIEVRSSKYEVRRDNRLFSFNISVHGANLQSLRLDHP
jgi:hypothetical protein